jgi:2OG-Fe(II) oxygenase superfamily
VKDTDVQTVVDRVLAVPSGDCGAGDVTVDRIRYAAARPWPHIVIDGLFGDSLLRAVEVEQTAVARTLRPHASRRQVKAERSQISGEASRMLMAQLGSDDFVRFLRDLTGITDLEPDPSHFWAGLHVSPVGAFQTVHRDFQKHPATGAFHRLNVLVYLTSGWQPAEGAELELWEQDASGPARRVSPVAGRVVIFESNAGTPHAVAPQTSPDPERLRLSFAAYYYSSHPPPGGVRRIGTLVQPRSPGQSRLTSVIDVADAARGAGRRLAVLPARIGRRFQPRK